MQKKPTITEKKRALFKRYVRIYQNYYGKNGIPAPFIKSWSYPKCEKAYEALKQTIHIDKTQRRYLARIAGVSLTPELQNETMAQITLKHFFTDSQIKQFPFEAVENPHFSSARSMKIYNLYDVMQTARRKKMTPRVKEINWQEVESRHRDKLLTLHAYFVQYVKNQAEKDGVAYRQLKKPLNYS